MPADTHYSAFLCHFETIHNDAYTCFHCQAASATADKHSGKTADLNRRKPILPNRKFVTVFSDLCQNLIYRARSTYRLTDRFKCCMFVACARLTFIEAIVIHVSIHIQILSSHKGEFCFRMLIWSIVRVIT